jgi:hypothetical protein
MIISTIGLLVAVNKGKPLVPLLYEQKKRKNRN